MASGSVVNYWAVLDSLPNEPTKLVPPQDARGYPLCIECGKRIGPHRYRAEYAMAGRFHSQTCAWRWALRVARNLYPDSARKKPLPEVKLKGERARTKSSVKGDTSSRR